MAKLYPPYVEGTIPAFYGTVLTVPFSMNKSESSKNVSGMHLKVKTVQNNNYIISCYSSSVTMETSSCQAVFQLTDSDVRQLKIGQYYKIQIAYVNHNNQVGYYSDVAIVKYTGQPVVAFEGLSTAAANTHRYNYIGTYTNATDPSEIVYSYCFNLYDNYQQLIQTSGERIHNSSANDGNDLNTSYDLYTIEQDLSVNKVYYLEYIVTTVNKMTVSTGKVRLIQQRSIDPEIHAELIASLNFENGYIALNLNGYKNDDGIEEVVSGTFKILRASDETNYATWNEVVKFSLQSQLPSQWSWKDFTIKQGIMYKYALQQYNDTGLSSNRLESDYIFADFEHAFLYDGKRQLKIKYNPQISSFKDTVLESKIDTLGGKYPFIFRNGNIRYKEFPINGLISCQSDDELLFTSEHTFRNFGYNVDLTGENIATEREFKLEVLDWLNNGEVKLFRSPAEGNYLVRLMTNSLTPNDQLGRMLHTFSSQAIEIAEYTYDNLRQYGLLLHSEFAAQQLCWESVELAPIHTTENLLKYQAVALKIEGATPGDKLWINDGKIRKQYIYNEDGTIATDDNGVYLEAPLRLNSTTNLPLPGYEVVIGITGNYEIEFDANTTITSVSFTLGAAHSFLLRHQGILTYAYYNKAASRFDVVENVHSEDIPLQQFIGYHDVLSEIQDIKTEVRNIFYIRSFLRDIHPVTRAQYDDDTLIKNPLTLYYLTDENLYIDGRTGDSFAKDAYNTTLTLNDVIIELKDTGYYELMSPENLTTIISGNGIILEMTYQKQIIDYVIEDDYITYKALATTKQAVNDAHTALINSIWGVTDDVAIQEQYRTNYNTLYDEYKILLTESLKTEGEIQGEIAK